MSPPLTTQLNQALYQPSATGNAARAQHAQLPLRARRSRRRQDLPLRFDLCDRRRRCSAPQWISGARPGRLARRSRRHGRVPSVVDHAQHHSLHPSQLVTSIGGKKDTTTAAKVSGNATSEQPYDFAAIADLYFAAAFLPDSPERATLVTQNNAVDVLQRPLQSQQPEEARPVLGVAMGDVAGVDPSARLRRPQTDRRA